MSTDFTSVLEGLAEQDPDQPAVTSDSESLSRAEFVDRVHRLAVLFAGHGVVEGSTVTIGLPNSIGFLECMFASWVLGAVPQPISHRLAPGERSAIVELAHPALVVGVPEADCCGRAALPSIPSELPAGGFTPGVSPVWKIMPSGGSTGRPKLIAATDPARLDSVAGLGALGAFPHDGCVLVTGPLAHNGPFCVATVGLLFGNHVVVMPRFDAEETLRLIARHRVEWVYLVPTMMSRIWHLPEEVRLASDVSSLKVAFHMAAPCPAWLKEVWIDWLGPERIFELYGGTEFQAATVITGDEWLAHRGSVGRPVVGELSIRDDDGRPVPSGDTGEIWMRRGPEVPSTYRYIGATARSSQDGWESLGDMGYLDGDGYLYITDRMTDMILVGGTNIYPAEIEAALDQHPAVLSSCVVGLPDEDLGSVPHAIVEVSGAASDDELLSFLKERLAPSKLPRSIERVSTPLRDDAGKVRRSALRSDRLP